VIGTRWWSALIIAAAAALGACGSDATTAPTTAASVSVPGFDISIYPGEAALRAWKYPASPYRWVGYYLPAPCHHDTTWSGTHATVTSLGWGTAAIYVGQQDWAQIPLLARHWTLALDSAEASISRTFGSLVESVEFVTCSATLLTADQGAAEAADAITRLRADGFPNGSTVYLDVEFVKAVSPALVEYIRGWFEAVLADGRYRPGMYAAKSNAAQLFETATAAYRTAHRTDAPPFWIASSTGFSMAARPVDVGLAFATLWQGMYEATQRWGGSTLTIDVDVAESCRTVGIPGC
jgi:hypothetical protein